MFCREVNTAKDKLHNDVIETLKKNKVGFLPSQRVIEGGNFVSVLTNALWYLDPQLEKLAQRHIHLPELYSKLKGYRDMRKAHQKIPEIKSVDMEYHVGKLADILMAPWSMNKQFSNFRSALSQLVDGMQKYLDYLQTSKTRSANRHLSEEPIRGFKDNWLLEKLDSVSVSNSSDYDRLQESLSALDDYTPLPTTEFEPQNVMDRRKWYQNLKLPFPVTKFTYRFGNNLGNLVILWKIPENQEYKTTEEIRILNEIRMDYIPRYATRAMQKDFINTYARTGMKPMVLRNIYKILTGFEFAPESEVQSAVDRRVCDFLLSSDDAELIMDLRSNIGVFRDSKYDDFWNGLEKLLDSVSAAHERRQGQISYLPFAISVEDLRQRVLDTLPDGTPAPSTSWLRLQFYPSNCYRMTAMNYTGKFNVRYKVQQRLLRSQHEDARYCLMIFHYLKTLAVKYRDHTLFHCCDDKAIIPVGESMAPVSTGARARHRSLVANGQELLALDHDYHVAGIVPSVTFAVEIPENVQDSFYRGQVHVTVKDKIFQPSSPLRHAVENVNIIREQSPDGVNSHLPILLRFTDGGPDHRTTYKTVQLASVLEFVALDLDFLVLARTAPAQSYSNRPFHNRR